MLYIDHPLWILLSSLAYNSDCLTCLATRTFILPKGHSSVSQIGWRIDKMRIVVILILFIARANCWFRGIGKRGLFCFISMCSIDRIICIKDIEPNKGPRFSLCNTIWSKEWTIAIYIGWGLKYRTNTEKN